MRLGTSTLLGLFVAALVASCGGGGSGAGGAFGLIEFLEAGKDSIPRNRVLTFLFSGEVAPGQDFSERLKIENVQVSQGTSNFSRAIGIYMVTGDRLTFLPRLPEKADRSDAGLRADGSYTVFLKAGPDSLASTAGDRIVTQQEFKFDTGEFFEDPAPAEPPRALGLVAVDTTSGTEIDISRSDPRPVEQALIDNSELIAGGKVIDPGAGGLPAFGTPWQFDLLMSEPVDPATVSTKNVEMFEVYSDATTTDENSAPGAPAGHFGTPVSFKVPINVSAVQTVDAQGNQLIRIRVVPLFTLVDDTRYRLVFSGNILGIDYRKSFIGDNGLTGDGQTVLAQSTPYPEPGGLGYTTEFIVRDRPAISAVRTVTYDPLADGIRPETGQSTTDESLFNSALYNPATDPGTAVGFLSAFGDGVDGNLAVSGGNTVVIDTGDTPNASLGNPFTPDGPDLDPDDLYNSDTRPGRVLSFDQPEPFELKLASLTVSSSSTLRLIGVNPVLFRVAGIVQVAGTIDASGGNGSVGGGSSSQGGEAGAGGWAGGDSQQGANNCSYRNTSGCGSFQAYLNGCSPAKNGFPFSKHGEGPGRGLAGGEAWGYYAQDHKNNSTTGIGGGGGSHATQGTAGEDRRNAGGAPGTAGPACSAGFGNTRNSGVIGVRAMPGPTYGDREIVDVIMGGSGGGAGGAQHVYNFGSNQQAGGAGGGGGGALTIVSSGAILAAGGVITVAGGDGGKGVVKNGGFSGWDTVTGSGGGGAGGALALISGDAINLTGAMLHAEGGTGGPRPNAGTTTSCNGCNAGGDGGKGFLFLMDADGQIEGFLPGSPGEYDADGRGVLTVSAFSADRFSSISAITELFNVLAADPDYLDLAPGDVLGNVSPGQRIRVQVSSAKGDLDEPLLPDTTSEIGLFEVALVKFAAGAVTVDVTGDMDDLNPAGQVPNRDAFVRVRANFEYDNGVEAALGPFASIDRMDISYTFNG